MYVYIISIIIVAAWLDILDNDWIQVLCWNDKLQLKIKHVDISDNKG